MHANTDDLAVLERIQQLDRDIASAERTLTRLPQRATILEARSKRREVQEKSAKVEQLRAKADERFAALADEEERLAGRAAKLQAELDEAKGTYRDVEKRTKELGGIAKRRATLEADIDACTDELAKIEALQAQVAAALAELDERESAATEQFVAEGGALKRTSARLGAEREAACAEVSDAQLLALYEQTAQRCGGVALGRLQGGRCGVCRAELDSDRLVDMRASGNLSVCPQCGRLLVVE